MANPLNKSVLPVGVVIPTLNSVAYLPAHLASMQSWVDVVAEVVVVDSQSTDGTVEYIRANLSHPNLRFFSRPRGLYQAWNFGVAQLDSRFCYFSTIGDTIACEGLQHLAAVAQRLESDVVISRPRFADTDGKTLPDLAWPIHALIKNLQPREARVLSRSETVVAALANGFISFLGSSASNLYRTDFLKKSPFPLTFGHMSDTAWGIQNCAELAVAISPAVHSTFLIHPKESVSDDAALGPRIQLLAQELKQRFQQHAELSRLPDALRACDVLAEVALEWEYQYQINQARKNAVPILSNARALVARVKRNHHRRRIRSLRRQFENQHMFISQP